MNTHKPSEKGQIVILLMLVMIVLLAFTALAIDGGMVFSDRRHAQSVADSASLAGAGAAADYLSLRNTSGGGFAYTGDNICLMSNMIDRVYDDAINRASFNGITITRAADLNFSHGVFVHCYDPTNPTLDPYTQIVRNPGRLVLDVIVRLSGHTDTAFAHLVTGNQLAYQVESVTRVYPSTAPGLGNALLSTDDTFTWNGVNQTVVNNGNATSCVDMVKNGSSGTITVNNGEIQHTTGYNQWMDHPNVNPSPTQITSCPDDWDWAEVQAELEARCAALPNRGSSNNNSPAGGILPGQYTNIDLHATNGVLELQPGLYCVSSGMNINGGTIRDIEANGFKGVTFYIGRNARVSISGGVTVDLSAPMEEDSREPNAMFGVLFYLHDQNSVNNAFAIAGTSESSYTGGIYAPNSYVTIGGTSNINPTFNTQVIAYGITINGTSNLGVNYDVDWFPHKPPKFSVLK